MSKESKAILSKHLRENNFELGILYPAKLSGIKTEWNLFKHMQDLRKFAFYVFFLSKLLEYILQEI